MTLSYCRQVNGGSWGLGNMTYDVVKSPNHVAMSKNDVAVSKNDAAMSTGRQVDVWAAGVTLYVMASSTGSLPFSGVSIPPPTYTCECPCAK